MTRQRLWRGKSFRIRRSRYVLFRIKDQLSLDLIALLKGRCKEKAYGQIIAAACLTSKEVQLKDHDLEVLLQIPSDKWVTCSELGKQSPITTHHARWLARQGLVITNIPRKPFSLLKERENTLRESQWHTYSAVYHFMSRWHNVFPTNKEQTKDLRHGKELSLEENELDAFIKKYGPSPPAFFRHPQSKRQVDLPLPYRSSNFFELLNKRKTTRSFDKSWVLSSQDLSTLLYYVYGCHGQITVRSGLVGLRKTSPSGGGLHPTEVYLLIMRVNGMNPGLYHYSVQNHALELIDAMPLSKAHVLANEFTCGQVYPQWANVLFIMSSRFFRNFWKYRNHPKAYSVLLMDAAHLSQTFYLTCAELGLGAFVTAAVNSKNIEDKLRINDYGSGVLAVCGCGMATQELSALEPAFESYTPKRR